MNNIQKNLQNNDHELRRDLTVHLLHTSLSDISKLNHPDHLKVSFKEIDERLTATIEIVRLTQDSPEVAPHLRIKALERYINRLNQKIEKLEKDNRDLISENDELCKKMKP